MPYTHLSIEEREQIQELLWQGAINPSHCYQRRKSSQLSPKLKKNCPQIKRYTPRLAQERAIKNTHSRGREKRLKNEQIREYVITHLKEGWSPKQIAGRIKLDTRGTHLSQSHLPVYLPPSLQKWLGRAQAIREDLRIYLRRKRKRRQKKGLRKVAAGRLSVGADPARAASNILAA